MKKCNRCGEEKELSEFYKNKGTKDGHLNQCKKCNRVYEFNNKEERSNQKKEHYKNNRERLLKRQRESDKKRKDKINEYNKKNKERRRKYINGYQKNRRGAENNYKLLYLLRTRIYNAITNQFGDKAFKSMELLGCTVQEIRQHLENQFRKGMSWGNYGRGGWSVDHIIPCDSFDLTDPEQQKQCFHYTNLQPLWQDENIRKNNKIVDLTDDWYLNSD